MLKIVAVAALLLTSAAAYAVTIENDAEIFTDYVGNKKLFAAIQGMIKGNGYRCDSLSNLYPFTFGQGYRVSCNHWSLSYELEDQGNNNWLVKQK
jgi:hypothetical protein